ncbi:MAG: adenylyl-sulfate kinase [Nocardioidaceae bacterium]
MPTQWTPSARELDDLELVLIGALDGPLVLQLPHSTRAEETLELTDPEGLPLATYDVGTGAVTALAHPEFGPFRRYHRTPAEIRALHPNALAVAVTAPLTRDAAELIHAAARIEGAVALLLAYVGTGSPRGLSGPALVRATLAAAELMPWGAEVVAVAAARRDDAEADAAFRDDVALAFADQVLHLPADERAELPDPVAAVVARDRPDRDRRGLVVFFTGLSGSGKSTLARALHDVLLERGDRTVTSLDGDVVRRHLSAGLGFSRADREANIGRIGWVAAEVARHGGVALCSPIAPFDRTRREVRAMVEAAGGGFVLVHVSTPLAECERRDRKGLYASARAGEIPDFTGVSSPYEVPDDAEVTVDTTGRSIASALDDVLETLHEAGWLRPLSH